MASQYAYDTVKNIFLCEIAPGKQFVSSNQYTEKAEFVESEYDSTLVKGSHYCA